MIFITSANETVSKAHAVTDACYTNILVVSGHIKPIRSLANESEDGLSWRSDLKN